MEDDCSRGKEANNQEGRERLCGGRIGKVTYQKRFGKSAIDKARDEGRKKCGESLFAVWRPPGVKAATLGPV